MAASLLACTSAKAAQTKPVEQTLATFEDYLKKNNADVTETHSNSDEGL
jgi:hypothetical protein